MYGICYHNNVFQNNHQMVRDKYRPDPDQVLPKLSALDNNDDLERSRATHRMGCKQERYLDKILEEKFTSVFRKGYLKVDGVTMPERFLDLKDDIYNLEVKNSDIWICSFPKTGTTWTQEMVWMIANDLDFKGGKVNLGHRFPFLEVSALFDYRQLMVQNDSFRPPPFLSDSLKFVRSRPDPKFIKSHLPWNLLPRQIQEEIKNPKIIYIARNPLDTCISYYHHSKLLEGFKGTFEEFCDLFLGDKVNFGPYWNHVIEFWERRKEPNILFLKYEDMKKNLSQVVKQVAEFLGKELAEKETEILCDHLNFNSMRRNDAVNYEMVVELNKKFKLIEHDGTFMRSGTVGNYKQVMSAELIERFNRWTQKHTMETDVDFYKNLYF